MKKSLRLIGLITLLSFSTGLMAKNASEEVKISNNTKYKLWVNSYGKGLQEKIIQPHNVEYINFTSNASSADLILLNKNNLPVNSGCQMYVDFDSEPAKVHTIGGTDRIICQAAKKEIIVSYHTDSSQSPPEYLQAA